jgi:hypothetical protein
MPKTWFIKEWRTWYGRNSSRFPFPVRIEERTKNLRHYDLKFDGIAPELVFCINNWDVLCFVVHKKQWWDCFILADVPDIKKTAAGYYCKGCKDWSPEPLKIYAKRDQLWAEHCFEPMLEWINVNFTPDRWVCLCTIGRGSTQAFIKSKKEMKQMRTDKEFVHVFPILQPKKKTKAG